MIVWLPTELVARYREVDREAHPRDPSKYEALVEDIEQHGIRVPLRLSLSTDLGYLSGGNHRLAAALRLGIPMVPVELLFERPGTRRDASQPMCLEDLGVIFGAYEQAASRLQARLARPA